MRMRSLRGLRALIALALSLVTAGCFRSHERPPGTDAGEPDVGPRDTSPPLPACGAPLDALDEIRRLGNLATTVGFGAGGDIAPKRGRIAGFEGARVTIQFDDGERAVFTAAAPEHLEGLEGFREEPVIAGIEDGWHFVRTDADLFAGFVYVHPFGPDDPRPFEGPQPSSRLRLAFVPECEQPLEDCDRSSAKRFVLEGRIEDAGIEERLAAGEERFIGSQRVAHVASLESPVSCGGSSTFRAVVASHGTTGGD